jgi:hypothetical protein
MMIVSLPSLYGAAICQVYQYPSLGSFISSLRSRLGLEDFPAVENKHDSRQKRGCWMAGSAIVDWTPAEDG